MVATTQAPIYASQYYRKLNCGPWYSLACVSGEGISLTRQNGKGNISRPPRVLFPPRYRYIGASAFLGRHKSRRRPHPLLTFARLPSLTFTHFHPLD
jgi:hypothetical protein